MKPYLWHHIASALALAWCASGLHAAELATVTVDNANVRGQPTIFSEVVTQLKKDEVVSVLEQLTISNPKAGEPTNWARITMPANVPVWVSTLYVDADSKTVKARRLNLRAGPGEQYSSLGLLEKGDSIKTIRTVEGWMEIECPTNAHAYIASVLLGSAPAAATPAPAPAVAEKEKKAEKVAEEPVATPPPALDVQKVEEEKAPEAAKDVSVKQETPAPAPVPAPAAPTDTTAKAQVPVVVTPPPVAPPQPVADEPPPKRTVTREGIVKSAGSIQTPTYYQLHSVQNSKLINYLHSSKTNIVIEKFKGTAVIVTGQEGMDERWPNTPVLEVETLQPAPGHNE